MTSADIFPAGYSYNPDLLLDYEEQVAFARQQAAYQAMPLPTFEGVPQAEVVPLFNPTGADPTEIYAQGRYPRAMAHVMRTHSEFDPDRTSIDLWRIIERPQVVNGLGLVASRILVDNTVGDVENFEPANHLASNYEKRAASAEKATPFVSFTTDPEYMARNLILAKGFGIKQGRDSVIVHSQVHPNRVITCGKNREHEVLLVGGVAPEEYLHAYEVSDFVGHIVTADETIAIKGDQYVRDQALAYWN